MSHVDDVQPDNDGTHTPAWHYDRQPGTAFTEPWHRTHPVLEPPRASAGRQGAPSCCPAAPSAAAAQQPPQGTPPLPHPLVAPGAACAPGGQILVGAERAPAGPAWRSSCQAGGVRLARWRCPRGLPCGEGLRILTATSSACRCGPARWPSHVSPSSPRQRAHQQQGGPRRALRWRALAGVPWCTCPSRCEDVPVEPSLDTAGDATGLGSDSACGLGTPPTPAPAPAPNPPPVPPTACASVWDSSAGSGPPETPCAAGTRASGLPRKAPLAPPSLLLGCSPPCPALNSPLLSPRAPASPSAPPSPSPSVSSTPSSPPSLSSSPAPAPEADASADAASAAAAAAGVPLADPGCCQNPSWPLAPEERSS